MRLPLPSLGCVIAFALSFNAHAADTASDVFRKTLPAKPGGKMVIETDRGAITVSSGRDAEVSVEVVRKVTRGSEKKAAELLERHRVELVEDSGTFRLTADLEGEDRWSFRGPQLEVDIRVLVPREFHLDARTAGGSVRVHGLKGDVNSRTSGGSLHFEDLTGRIQGRTAGGSIRGHQLKGPVDVSTSGGSVELDGVAEGPIKAGTSGGSLRLVGIAGPLDARTSGGSIRLESSATPLFATTSGGSIEATLTAVPKEAIELRSSAGGVSLVLPEKSAFQLDASTSAGSVRSEFPVAVNESGNRSALKGPVNGGGPNIKLRSSAGSIRIQKP
jgi:DUF4097 and DUF4098 domain-containing protein YvlB